jgi:hypothetical protein
VADLINDSPTDGGMPQAVSMLASVLKAIAANWDISAILLFKPKLRIGC